MKSYTITVNGNVYDVTVEEKTGAALQGIPAPAAPVVSAPASGMALAATAASPAPVSAPAPATSAGAIAITAGAAGKVVDIVASVGTSVSKGDPVVILEVMKMETPVVAPEDGTLATIDVSKGQSVAAGEVLATMN